jgi:hypothetical protein
MASVASHNGTSVQTGDDIMIAGLAFQVFTMFMFMVVSLDFAINTWRRQRRLGSSALDQNSELVAMRKSVLFKGFLAALVLATICVFWRCVFRVAELSRGWSGPLTKREDLFVGFEGVMIVVATLVLNIFHPAFCVRPVLDAGGGWGKQKKAAVIQGRGKSETNSDVEVAKA